MADAGRNKGTRSIKLAISLLLFLLDYTLACARRATGGERPARCVVLYYHSIPAAGRSMFARQMDDILRYAEPIGVDRKAVLSEGLRYVAVTFDDAFENVFHNALPELEARRIPATIFVVTECLGKLPNWQHFGPDFNGNEKVMTADQLLALPLSLVSVGSHSMTHRVLTALNDQEAKKEIAESRVILERLLGRKITLFSFPYGAFNRNVIKWCEEAGYERVFTILPVLGLTKADEFVTGRVSVEPSDWPIEFRLKLLGAYRWLNSAFLVKRRITMSPVIRELLKWARESARTFVRIGNQPRGHTR